MAWSRCMICGRKAATFECGLGAGRLELCLFCISTLGLSGRVKCSKVRLSMEVSGVPTSASATFREEPDERLIEALRKATGSERVEGS